MPKARFSQQKAAETQAAWDSKLLCCESATVIVPAPSISYITTFTFFVDYLIALSKSAASGGTAEGKGSIEWN